MKIVGCDLHTRYQQIAMLDEETGELIERRLEHANGEAKQFYTNLSAADGWPTFPFGWEMWECGHRLRTCLAGSIDFVTLAQRISLHFPVITSMRI
jgi:hypothetical protein